jgi:predicted P-loop ATPase
MANHEKDQHPPVQGVAPEHSIQVAKTKAPGDAVPAPLTIAKWDGDDGNPDVIFYGIKAAHTPGDLFRSLAAYDPDLVRMFAAAQTHKGRWMSSGFFAEIEAEETIVPAETRPVPPNGLNLQPEPKAAPGFEGLKPADELKRFFDLVGIKAHGFVISTRYERKSKETGQWIESWSHYYAQRYGDGGNADLYDYLRYGGHKPSDKGKNSLLSRFRQKDSDTFRATQYYIRTAEFAKDPVDGMVRSFDKENVLRRRTYSTESDEGTLAQQVERIAYLKSKGLIPNAEVYSGDKSIHLHFARPREWETTSAQDAYIDMGLCVLFRGDAAAIAPNNAFRLPGCDRPRGRHQRLLDGRAEPYGSYEELRSVIEALLAEEGITDQAELEVAFAQRKGKSDEKRVRTAVEGSSNSVLGREWDDWEGWSETERKAARAFHQALSGEQLLDFIPRSAAELVRKGSPEGCRNDDGLNLTRHLRGAVDLLDDLGLKVEAAAQQVLDRFVEASEAVGGPVDVERLQAQYEGAEGAMPGRPVASFLNALAFQTDGRLGEYLRKPVLPEGSSGVVQLLEAIGPGEWGEDENGAPVPPPQIKVGDFASMLEDLGPALRWNDLSQQVEYNGETLKPEDVELLYVDLHRQDRYVSQKTAIDVVVSRSRKNRYDPVREYLEFVEKAEDIEPIDLGRLASTYLGTEDPLYDEMLRVAILGAVSRRMEPGCKYDYVVVLKGDQGIRKSTFWEVLASPAWYNSSVPDDDKDLLLNVHATWFFELAELEHVTNKRSAGKLKNTITTSIDNFRPPYGKAPAPMPRPSIFVSTVNGDAFLRDDTGERRYLVIECPQVYAKGELINLDAVVRDRDRIWKAAMLAYRAGEKPYLSHELQNESNSRNDDYQVEHPWGSMLDEWLNKSPERAKVYAHIEGCELWKAGAPKQFDSRQALVGSGVRDEKNLSKNDEMQIASLLKQRGYVKRQVMVAKRRKWLWSKPEEVT